MDGPEETAQTFVTLVDLLRHRASEVPDRLLFSFLADSESTAASTVTRYELDLRGVPWLAGCVTWDARRAGTFALPAWDRIHSGLLRMPVCGCDRRSGLPSQAEPADDPSPIHRRGRRADRRSDLRIAAIECTPLGGGAPELKNLQVLCSDAQPEEAARYADDWSHPGVRPGVAGVSPVHLGLDRDAQGSDDHSWQSAP